MLIAVCFLGVLLLSLTLMLVMTRPTAEQKSMERRIVSIKDPEGYATSANYQIEQYLTTRQKSDFEWLEQIVANSNFSRSMQLLLMQADSQSTVGTVLATSLGLGVAGAILPNFFVHILPVTLLVGILFAMGPYLMLLFKRANRLNKFNAALPEAIDMIARSLRAGHSLAAAISNVAEQAPEPAKSEFAEVFKKQNYGLPMRDALLQLLERVPSQDLRVLITGIMVQRDTGGNLVDILERIVQVIRERQRIQREINTHTAQGRMTGYILCALPIVLLVIINMLNPGYSNVLFDDPLGREMLYAGVGLLLLGGFLIRQIINGIEI
jgi:tight adherence protein B